MIRCLPLSKQDADQWQRRHPPTDGDPLSDLYKRGNDRYGDEDIVAIVALDGETPIGKVVLGYSDVLVNDTWLRCLVPGGLYVTDAYRSKAVGMMLLLELLKTRRPLIASGVSAAAAEIYDRLPQFHRVDATPMYLIGLNLAGSVRVGRLVAQRAGGGASRIGTLACVVSQVRASMRTRSWQDASFVVLAPDLAVQWLENTASLKRYPVQLPWSRAVLTQSIRSQELRHRSWVLRDGTGALCLMDMYLRTERLTLLRSSNLREVLVATLTEVFPPVSNRHLARYVLSEAARRAAAMGATLLFVCASTPELAEACQSFGHPHMADKSVYVCPNGLDEKTARILKDPSMWWCRARSEEQFRESYIGSAIVAGAPPTLLT
jgi:GNAT superfamily N-acetyltransferase